MTICLLLSIGAIGNGQAAARERTLLDADWRFHLGEVSGYVLASPGIPVTQWVWIADANAPNDVGVMAAPGLNTSGWSNITVGTDVFNGSQGAAWYRATLTNLASAIRPVTLRFLGVDDDATVYLNGHLVGQHSGWSDAFDLAIDPAWIASGTNVLAVAVVNSGGGAGGIMDAVLLQTGADAPPPGMPVSQWRWVADDNAAQDAATMTATNLDTSAWQIATNGQDVFQGRVGYAWFRASLDGLASTNRPLTLHFGCVDDNATVYLNGILLGQHTSASQAFDIASVGSAWSDDGPNILAVAVQNTGGPGGIAGLVTLESGVNGQLPDGGDPNDPRSLGFNDQSWRAVRLPHDYVIEGTFTNTANVSHGSLPLDTAWYRRTFTLPAAAQGKSIWVDFDGVYHKSRVWLNGHYLGYWHSGYASFRHDISRFAIPGGTNVLAVYVDPSGEEGWWYEGGGIYRHVWLNIANSVHVAPWGTFVTSEVQGPDVNGNASATLTISTLVTNAAAQTQICTVVSRVVGPDGVTAGTLTTPVTVGAGGTSNVVQSLQVTNARLWSIETPQLYELQTSLRQNDEAVDEVKTPFGIRSIRFDADKGFFLNGKRVEIKGMCNHQDFAGVGIAMPDNLHYWRILKLKEMGANAYRCAHNPPAPELLDACDRLGMLVMDENRHLGDSTGGYSSATAQTPYSDLSPLDNMILRDRNHPSIIMWSMCNEEGISGTQAAADIFHAMKQRVLQFDTTRPITSAMNHSWFNVGITLVQDLEGVNYSPGQYDPIHQSFPTMPVYASETASARGDRGMYTNDGVVYVSCLNTTTETSWEPVATRPYLAGAFVWTGFDYKGEPSPYGWPCINSKFGVMDMCGIPKDAYYYYRAWWRDEPSVHIFPHWNWSTGQTVNVWCYANSASVELFLNGASQGVRTMPAYGHVEWSVPYAAGTLLAKAYDGQGQVIATNQVTTAGPATAIQLKTDRTTLSADEQDLVVVYASVVDAQGRVVPTASNLVTFAISGPAGVVGVGNGDPASHEPDRASQRKAFNGWCMALVGATNAAGAVTLTASSPGLSAAVLNLQAMAITNRPAPVRGLSATAGDASVKLDWTISFDAASYNIKRSTVSGGPYTPIANYTAISFTDKSVTNGGTYYYVVSAVNTNGESLDSLEVSATPVAPAPPVTPTGFTALQDDGGVSLNWNTTPGAASYNVKRSPVSGGPFTKIANTATASYADSGLSNGATYFYVVSALFGGIESSNSVQASATPVSMSYLVGTVTGTTGSWNNTGNVREKAMDGDANTFFDAPTGNNNWVGLDLGTNTAAAISKILFYPRNGYSDRMVGGMFQGANTSNFSSAVTLATVASSPPFAANTLLITNSNAFRYLRYLAPANSYGNVAEVEFYTPGPHISRMTGTVLGTTGSETNTSDKAFDGSLTTYFHSTSSNGNWVGLDLGNAKVITHVRYCPRSTFGNRMLNGSVQGANWADFSGATNLYVITNAPQDATLTARVISNANAFRYVRYLSPANSYGDVAELQFFSSTPSLPALPAAPTGLSATAGNEQVGLSWNSSSGAKSYNVKRALVSGGPYTNIASRVATIHMDSGLGQGTCYYVVSAVNDAGESADSAEASATLTCASPSAPTGLAATAEAGQLKISWSPVKGAISYHVLRSTTNGGPYALLAEVLNNHEFVDAASSAGSTNYYVVQAANNCAASPNSSQIVVATLPAPYLNGGMSGASLFVSWPSWAGNYQLERATNLVFPVSWQPDYRIVEYSNGMYMLNIPATNHLEFYRLRLPFGGL